MIPGWAQTGSALLPHRSCLMLREDLMWLHVVSDALIALAYFAIPAILVWFDVHRRQRFYSWVLLLFASFILLCGVTHLFEIWTMWQPDYLAEGLVKAATAIVSLATAAALLPEVPRLLALRSPEELEALNRQLARESAARAAAVRNLEVAVSRLRRSNEDLERLSYVTSHDLKAPLRSIASFASLLEKRYGDRLDKEAAEYFAFIRAGVRQMQQMTDDLLKLYRVSTAEQREQAVDLSAVARKAVEQLGSVIGEHRARVEIDELPAVRGSEAELLALLRNLIGNALKFRRPGEPPRIRITAALDGDVVTVRVQDNGIGIPPEHAEEVFEVFRRLHTGDAFPGSGIGLSLCAKIVERDGGRIWVEQHDGPGATIAFTLPAHIDDSAPQRA